MTRVAKPPEMPRAEAFNVRAYQTFNKFRERVKEKRNKRGKIIRIGRVLPFDALAFKGWMLGVLGGTPDGAVQCRYCKVWLTALDVGFDHVEPMSQGGGLDFSNLAPCCNPCNRLKGGLSYSTFIWLLDEMNCAGLPSHMTVADRKNLESRLKTGGMQYRGKSAEKKKPTGILVEEQEEIF